MACDNHAVAVLAELIRRESTEDNNAEQALGILGNIAAYPLFADEIISKTSIINDVIRIIMTKQVIFI